MDPAFNGSKVYYLAPIKRLAILTGSPPSDFNAPSFYDGPFSAVIPAAALSPVKF